MIHHFGDFILDTERYELKSDDQLIAAEPKVLEALAYLVAQQGRVVGKEELVEKVWEGRFVTDSAVSRAIRQIRVVLGDSGAERRWVKTVYGRGFAFVGDVSTTPSARGETAVSGDLPGATLPIPLTRLIGRECELGEVSELLDRVRLLTLTGAGGTGKTRLAVEVAGRTTRSSVAFVSLAEISEPQLVAPAIARVLGTGDSAEGSQVEALRFHIGDQELLLVLDNYEHVAEAASVVVDLLRGCPNLTALVTSRFALRVEGEQEYLVPPLALPESGTEEAEFEEVPSVALFLERAQAARHEFRPDGRELAYIGEICRRLDGLPLAIEFAAARVKLLPPRDLWQRLAERLDLLSAPTASRPDRHKTLELAFAWSYDLLSIPERDLLSRLAVFAGGFTLAAAENVCANEGEGVVAPLAELVDKSLVACHSAVAGEARFGLLETTRVYARERYRTDRRAPLRDAHARWVLEVARRGAEALVGADQKRWLERLDAEHGNLLAALRWARTGGDLEVGLATAAAVTRYWSSRGIYREGRREIEALFATSGSESVESPIRAAALTALGSLRLLLCDFVASEEALEGALDILRPLGERQDVAHTLNHLGWVVAQSGDLARAAALSQEALELHRELGNARGISVALNNLGQAALFRGEATPAEEYFGESLAKRRAAGDERGVAFALTNVAVQRLHLTDCWNGVDEWIDEAQLLVERLGDRPLRGWVLFARGALAVRRGAIEEAIPLLEESRDIARESGHRDGRGWAELMLGEAFQAANDHASARAQFEEVKRVYEELGSPWGVAVALRHLAEVSHGEGNGTVARALYAESLELFESFGAEPHAQACRDALAEIEV